MSLIEVSQLEYTYAGQKLPTLTIPTFKVERGEKLFLYGPSGSGKTTLLEILAGVLSPSKGSVKVLDQELANMSASRRDQFRAEKLGYIFQSFNLIPYLSVRENIELPCLLNSQRGLRVQKKNLSESVEFLAHRLGLSDFLQRSVKELSVGQQQRVAVARALIGRPDLILADEPTSSLDMDHREKFLKLLFELCEESGTTVVFVSHDRTIQQLFSRAVSLETLNQRSS